MLSVIRLDDANADTGVRVDSTPQTAQRAHERIGELSARGVPAVAVEGDASAVETVPLADLRAAGILWTLGSRPEQGEGVAARRAALMGDVDALGDPS